MFRFTKLKTNIFFQENGRPPCPPGSHCADPQPLRNGRLDLGAGHTVHHNQGEGDTLGQQCRPKGKFCAFYLSFPALSFNPRHWKFTYSSYYSMRANYYFLFFFVQKYYDNPIILKFRSISDSSFFNFLILFFNGVPIAFIFIIIIALSFTQFFFFHKRIKKTNKKTLIL